MKYQNKDGFTKSVLVGPVVLSADNTPVAQAVADFACVELDIAVGIGGITFDATNKIEFKLSHGDSATAADHTAVAAADVRLPSGVSLGSGGIVWALTAANAAAAMRTIEYIGGKSHISILADFAGTHGTGTPIAIMLRRSRGRTAPNVA